MVQLTIKIEVQGSLGNLLMVLECQQHSRLNFECTINMAKYEDSLTFKVGHSTNEWKMGDQGSRSRNKIPSRLHATSSSRKEKARKLKEKGWANETEPRIKLKSTIGKGQN